MRLWIKLAICSLVWPGYASDAMSQSTVPADPVVAAAATDHETGSVQFKADDRHAKERLDIRKGERSTEGTLAWQLSGLETRIGIRSGQLDAWREYTSALLALLAPAEVKDPADDPRGKEGHTGQAKDPFDRELKLVARLAERAAGAQRLKDSITKLNAALSDDQRHELLLASREDWLHIPRDAFDKSPRQETCRGVRREQFGEDESNRKVDKF